MLPKKYRLSSFQEIEKVKDKGKLFQFPFFGVLVLDNKESRPSRFSVNVSLKVAGNVVNRNKIKRLMSEAIKAFLSQIKPGFDLIILVKKMALKKSLGEIKEEVERAFLRTELLV